jgi:hypothetical protein
MASNSKLILKNQEIIRFPYSRYYIAVGMKEYEIRKVFDSLRARESKNLFLDPGTYSLKVRDGFYFETNKTINLGEDEVIEVRIRKLFSNAFYLFCVGLIVLALVLCTLKVVPIIVLPVVVIAVLIPPIVSLFLKHSFLRINISQRPE